MQSLDIRRTICELLINRSVLALQDKQPSHLDEVDPARLLVQCCNTHISADTTPFENC